jgi:hypothetical protein
MGVFPAIVTQEITESVFASIMRRSTRTHGELRGLGNEIAIDDFGTDTASFARSGAARRLQKNRQVLPGHAADLNPQSHIGDIISFDTNTGPARRRSVVA